MENSVNSHDNTSCPNCRAEFTCEIAAGKDHCWCFDLPRTAYVDLSAVDACRCPECVAKRIEELTPDGVDKPHRSNHQIVAK